MLANSGFWSDVQRMASLYQVVIDRPRGTAHPRYPQFIYPLDYGYLTGTIAQDGGGVDVWRGSRPEPAVTAVCVTADGLKLDSEIKLLLGCTPGEQRTVLATHNGSTMRGLLVTTSGSRLSLAAPPAVESELYWPCPPRDFWDLCDWLLSQHPWLVETPSTTDLPDAGLRAGWLRATQSTAGQAIDAWLGSGPADRVTAVLLRADWQQGRCEVTWLVGCTPRELASIQATYPSALLLDRAGQSANAGIPL